MASAIQSQLATANGQFASDMYSLISHNAGNIVFSPLSAHAALSMVYQGAKNQTKEDLAKALHLPDPKLAAEGYNKVMTNLNSAEAVTLSIANKVYVMQNYKMNAEFEANVTKKFHSEVQNLDFANNVESVKAINSWVCEKTKEKIKTLFKDDDVDKDTRLILVNAIYFKGEWRNQFKKHETRPQPFYLDETNTVECDMMHQTSSFMYKEDKALDAQILQMHYKNDQFSMVIILPREKTGLAELEKKLSTVDISKITEGMERERVELTLPKFKIEQTLELEDTLKKLGLGGLFDYRCNLSGMLEDENQNVEPLVVSKVIQKAFLDVNEEGAEAAAATGIKMMLGCSAVMFSGPGPIVFKADHSFIYSLLTKVENNLNMFVGRLIEPNAKK